MLAGKPSICLLEIRQENLMSDLVAIVYPSEAEAEKVRQRLFDLRKQYLIEFSDAVIAVKTDAGPVKLNQLVNTTAAGAASGSFWGLLIGIIFLNPLIGVALGAASGALGGALTDYGINDAFMKELAANLKPGDAALFVLIQNMTADKVLKEIQSAGGTVLKTSLDDAKEKGTARSPRQSDRNPAGAVSCELTHAAPALDVWSCSIAPRGVGLAVDARE
jgi:uncharacterized membrane protein